MIVRASPRCHLARTRPPISLVPLQRSILGPSRRPPAFGPRRFYRPFAPPCSLAKRTPRQNGPAYYRPAPPPPQYDALGEYSPVADSVEVEWGPEKEFVLSKEAARSGSFQ